METKALTRRDLLVHDALAFASLTLVTIALFAITLLLFRSFTSHRAQQAILWEQNGRAALSRGDPEEAVRDFRTALSFAPETRAYEMLLAQSLSATGPKHTDEAYNYFLELWETQPGDGQINLELARLAQRRGDSPAAVRFFRSAIDGRWDESGAHHRRDDRLELARYLITLHSNDPAQAELLIVGGNWRDDPAVQTEVARLLAQAGDATNALANYRRALAIKPDEATLLEAARLAYNIGNFDAAHAILQSGSGNAAVAELRDKVERLLALDPSTTLSPVERVRHIVAMRSIARRRWDDCTRQPSTEWKTDTATATAATLLHGPALQESAIRLVYDTEIETDQTCGPPTGDDALLLHLAQTAKSQAAGSQAAGGAAR